MNHNIIFLANTFWQKYLHENTMQEGNDFLQWAHRGHEAIIFILIQVKFITFVSISKATFPNELVKKNIACLIPAQLIGFLLPDACLKRERKEKCV